MARTAAAQVATATTYSEIDLSGDFALSSPARRVKAKTIQLPGDVHTALLAAGDIPDPYIGANEQAVMWVHATPWTVERRFTATREQVDGYLPLTLEGVDCVAAVFLNGEENARTQSQFV